LTLLGLNGCSVSVIQIPTTYEEALVVIQRLLEKIADLECRLAAAEARAAAAEARVAELEKILDQKKPPDPSTPSGMTPVYRKPNREKGRKKKPGRKRGHRGARRDSAQANNHEHHAVDHCPECGTNLIDEPVVSTRTRITEDIAEKKEPEVTCHAIESKWCPKCKRRVEARVDAALPRCTLGLRVLLLTAWMHYALGTTGHAIVKYLRRVHDFVVTAGGLVQAWRGLAEALVPMHEAIWQEILRAGVLYADETGWRVGGKTCWLWCFATKQAVYYVIDRTRGSPVVLRVLGEVFSGVLVSDFFAAYGFVQAAAKQKCLAHLLRELEKVSLRNANDEWRDFAARTRRLVKDALRLGVERKALADEEYDRRWRRLYDRLSLIHNASYTDKDCQRLARRLEKYRFELFTFLERENVDATNNHAERVIRPAVLMRKNYYGNRSERGAIVQAILMSIFRTLEMRGVDPLDYLEQSLRANLAHAQAFALPPLQEQAVA
jgi:transposase